MGWSLKTISCHDKTNSRSAQGQGLWLEEAILWPHPQVLTEIDVHRWAVEVISWSRRLSLVLIWHPYVTTVPLWRTQTLRFHMHSATDLENLKAGKGFWTPINPIALLYRWGNWNQKEINGLLDRVQSLFSFILFSISVWFLFCCVSLIDWSSQGSYFCNITISSTHGIILWASSLKYSCWLIDRMSEKINKRIYIFLRANDLFWNSDSLPNEKATEDSV